MDNNQKYPAGSMVVLNRKFSMDDSIANGSVGTVVFVDKDGMLSCDFSGRKELLDPKFDHLSKLDPDKVTEMPFLQIKKNEYDENSLSENKLAIKWKDSWVLVPSSMAYTIYESMREYSILVDAECVLLDLLCYSPKEITDKDDQNALKKYGHTVREVIDMTASDVAKAYIKNGDFTQSEYSQLVGYSGMLLANLKRIYKEKESESCA